MIEIVLTGLIYVFAVLGLIVLFILLLSLVTRGFGSRKGRDRKGAAAEKTIENPRETGRQIQARGAEGKSDGDAEGTAEGDAESGIDPKIICAITAAIDAFERDGEGRRFKILSFRRVGRN